MISATSDSLRPSSLQYLAGAIAGPLASVRGASATAMAVGMAATIATGLLVWALVLLPVRRELGTACAPAADVVEGVRS